MLLIQETTVINTPIGALEILSSPKGIAQIRWTEAPVHAGDSGRDCAEQLARYFAGEIEKFHSLTLQYAATDFQRDVWETLIEVPFGETVTYAELAKEAGHMGAARAVGTALRMNPLCIIIPCHRVVPESGGVGEYAGGTWRKEWLLRHEGVLQ